MRFSPGGKTWPLEPASSTPCGSIWSRYRPSVEAHRDWSWIRARSSPSTDPRCIPALVLHIPWGRLDSPSVQRAARRGPSGESGTMAIDWFSANPIAIHWSTRCICGKSPETIKLFISKRPIWCKISLSLNIQKVKNKCHLCHTYIHTYRYKRCTQLCWYFFFYSIK